MPIRCLILAGFAALLFIGPGCQTEHSFEKLHPGMTRAQVLHTLGAPKYVATDQNHEFFWYKVNYPEDISYQPWTEPYYVELTDGIYERYGKQAEFEVPAFKFVKFESWMKEDAACGMDCCATDDTTKH